MDRKAWIVIVLCCLALAVNLYYSSKNQEALQEREREALAQREAEPQTGESEAGQKVPSVQAPVDALLSNCSDLHAASLCSLDAISNEVAEQVIAIELAANARRRPLYEERARIFARRAGNLAACMAAHSVAAFLRGLPPARSRAKEAKALRDAAAATAAKRRGADEEEDGADAAASFSFSPPAISLGGSPAGSSPGGFTFASGQAAGGFSFTPPRMRSGSEEGEESPTY